MQHVEKIVCPVCKVHQPVSEKGREPIFSIHQDGEESCLGSGRNLLDAAQIAAQTEQFDEKQNPYPKLLERRRSA